MQSNKKFGHPKEVLRVAQGPLSKGFTLVELMVVITLTTLMLVTALTALTTLTVLTALTALTVLTTYVMY